MMAWKSFVLTVVASAASVDAPALAPRALAAAVAEARVGQWVLYALGGPHRDTRYVRLAVVKPQPGSSGEASRWLEVELGMDAALRSPVARMALEIRTGKGGVAFVSRVVLAYGWERPVEVEGALSERWLAATRLASLTAPDGAVPGADVSVALSVRPGERLMTGAGTLESTRYEARRQGVALRRVWTSRQVPLLGLARMEVAGSGDFVEVHGFGEGATPRVDIPARPLATMGVEHPGASPPEAWSRGRR
jgi:hypothetical protein